MVLRRGPSDLARPNINDGGMNITKRVSAPFPGGYAPELDTSPELGNGDTNYYYTLIDVM